MRVTQTIELEKHRRLKEDHIKERNQRNSVKSI
jgi:hypothetical protein